MDHLILSLSPDRFKVFFACPISMYIDPVTSRLNAGYEHFIRTVHGVIGELSDETFLAIEREEWGASILPSQVCTPLDFVEMQRCDVVVAYPGRSCGVPVELGWATALGKPVVLLLRDDEEYTPVILGLKNVQGFRVQEIRMRAAGDAGAFDPDRITADLRRTLGALVREWREAMHGGDNRRLAGTENGLNRITHSTQDA
ncbi:MAG: hypothetical protein JST22_13820 [Bacteroidetes bacterium]|nr:hypothetical protein [Bacteroidota bacterium]